MPKLALKRCTRSKEPVELRLLSSAKLKELGCYMELTAYDNEPSKQRSDDFTR